MKNVHFGRVVFTAYNNSFRFNSNILLTFGPRTGSGVVDVAGGAGHLSVMLACYDDISCTIIDPRHSDFASLAAYLSTRRGRSAS